MTKQAQQNKLKQQNGLTTLEQNTIVDDSLLPPAEELAKLKELDPDIITWIKERTEKEQDARIRFNDARIDLVKKDVTETHSYNKRALSFALIVILSGMFFSVFLICQKLQTEGTIFAGATIVFAGISFVRASSNKKKEIHQNNKK